MPRQMTLNLRGCQFGEPTGSRGQGSKQSGICPRRSNDQMAHIATAGNLSAALRGASEDPDRCSDRMGRPAAAPCRLESRASLLLTH